jgi:hypothetical protein
MEISMRSSAYLFSGALDEESHWCFWITAARIVLQECHGGVLSVAQADMPLIPRGGKWHFFSVNSAEATTTTEARGKALRRTTSPSLFSL